MKATWTVDAIGWNGDETARRLLPAIMYEALQPMISGRNRLPWCAEITGEDEKYGLARKFLKPNTDLKHANRRGTSGVKYWFILESGRYYETSHRESWNSDMIRQYRTVTPSGEIIEITRDEVWQWARGCSE